MPEPGQSNVKEDTTKDDDDWLTDEIREEVRKLDQLEQQLSEVVKPEVNQETEQLKWKTQQIGKFKVELEQLATEAAEQFTTISDKSPTSVATIISPTKTVPNLIPPNNHHLFETKTGVCAKSEGASATSEGAERGGTIAVRARVC